MALTIGCLPLLDKGHDKGSHRTNQNRSNENDQKINTCFSDLLNPGGSLFSISHLLDSIVHDNANSVIEYTLSEDYSI